MQQKEQYEEWIRMHVWEAIAMDEDRQLRPPEEGDQAAEDMEVTYEDTRRFAKCSR